MTHLQNTPKPPSLHGTATPVSAKNLATRPAGSAAPVVPPYLSDTYHWAYINPRNVRFLDRDLVVSIIFWGNRRRLQKAAFDEISPGMTVLQPACVYGEFSSALARHVGAGGCLDVVDVVPIQIASCRRKLREFSHATARLADSKYPAGKQYDAVCCYFLLHELPEDYKRLVVNALLASVRPGGKVIFVDYHKPHWAHPVKPVTSLIFDNLKPFAKQLWRHEIADFADRSWPLSWKKDTYFGGLFQRVVAIQPE